MSHDQAHESPRDRARFAKLIVDIVTGEVEHREPTPEEQDKDPQAVKRGKLVWAAQKAVA
jgi:hypothetical protein